MDIITPMTSTLKENNNISALFRKNSEPLILLTNEENGILRELSSMMMSVPNNTMNFVYEEGDDHGSTKLSFTMTIKDGLNIIAYMALQDMDSAMEILLDKATRVMNI